MAEHMRLFTQLIKRECAQPGERHIMRYLEAGHGIEDPDVQFPHGTLLHVAVAAESTRPAKVLLDAGTGTDDHVFYLDCCIAQRSTCLSLACAAIAGANPNARTSEGPTPLMMTFAADMATCLCDSGANISADQGRSHSTCLCKCRGSARCC
jgi:hypothetical protein